MTDGSDAVAAFDSEEANASEEVSAEETPIVPDPALIAARAQARLALAEITDAKSIGADAGHEVHEERVVTLFFMCEVAGYPGWRWAATLARVDDESEVNVLEVELLPGEGAVVAPEWVPWSERLAQFRATQAKQAADEAAAAKNAAAELSDEDDAEDDLLDNDFSDFDDEIDGVDVDGAYESDDDDDADHDDDEDDDDSDDHDDDSDDDDDDDSDDDDDDDDDSDDEDSEDE